jgi:tonB-linked outer membrane protein, susC/ragA family
MLTVTSIAWAQSHSVTGTVLDADGTTPLVGCTIIVEGTTTGTTTEANGSYSIKVNGNDAVLVFQSLGYETQNIPVGSRTTINVTMQEAATKIADVVVTALGLTREEKSLGYAVSKVSNEDITASVASNWINNMSGKVAGLSMSSAGTGPGGTVRVTLRGDASLNYGSNEALFVVDGVPILSGSTATVSDTNYANGDAPVDFGNAVSDLNPDDIENVSVLKGPAATALYGSRAANGAIVITTRSGRVDKGWGVTFNTSISFERAGFWPDFQDQYGVSAVTTSQTNRHASAWGLPGSMTYDGQPVKQQISRYAFGEKFDSNQKRYLYLSKNWETGEFTPLPWVYADDWYTGLFETGVTYTNSVSVEGSSGKGTSARFSFTDSRNEWILPNTGYNRQTYALTLNQKLNKHLDLAVKATFSRRQSDNMPVAGYDESSAMYGLLWGYNVNPMKAYRDEYFQGRYTRENYDLGAMGTTDPYNVQSSLVYNSLGGHNPYRVLYEELNTLVRNRVFGNVSLTAHILPGLDLMLRGGMDMNNDFRTQRKPKMTADYLNGMYREQTVREYEFNIDFLLKYQRSFFDDRLTLSAAFGGNEMRQSYAYTKITAPELEVDGVYKLKNSAVSLVTDAYRREKRVHSLYEFVNLGWDDTYFLDITCRTDWSSTLHPTNWCYSYPSVSASVLLDKAFKLNTPYVNMLKVRASWANVGNDTTPYSLYDSYSKTSLPGGFTLPGTLKDAMVKPENVESWEVGFEGKFFNNRVNFDIALYKNTTTDQILSVSQSTETGASGVWMNAGRVENKGIEISFRLRPVQTRDLLWEISGNWARNKNTLCELNDTWDPSVPLTTSMGVNIGGRTYVYSYIGEEMHWIYGRDYVRAPKGSTYTDENGRVIDCSGLPIINSETGYPALIEDPNQRIAKVNPDWKAGFGTSVRYKNLSFSAQFTAQMGGNSYSVTNFGLSYQGKLKNSLAGREDGLVLSGVNAVDNGNGTVTYKKNNTITENVYNYYNKYQWVRDNTKANTFSTDFLKLKEVRLDYKLPDKWMKKTKILRGASVGVFATNLFCITNWPQYDPEAAAVVSGTNIYGGIETGSFPMTRTYGFNVKLQF